jgi:hypothetical protein
MYVSEVINSIRSDLFANYIPKLISLNYTDKIKFEMAIDLLIMDNDSSVVNQQLGFIHRNMTRDEHKCFNEITNKINTIAGMLDDFELM